MSDSRARTRRNQALMNRVIVEGVRGVSVRVSAIERTCSSDHCSRSTIRHGDRFVRVLPPTGPSEDYHHECFEWEYVE